MQEKIINKIAALMNMTVENGATIHEALAAANKAQELIAKYHVSVFDSATEKETVGEEEMESPRKWFQLLANVVCKNMACRLIMFSQNRKTFLKFIGRESDRTAAIKTFQMLLAVCQRGIKKEKRRARSSKGVEFAYATGFITAVAEEMGKQSQALMLVVPSEVDKHIEAKYHEVCTRRSRFTYHYTNKSDIEVAKANGYHDGKSVIGQKKLVSKNV